jgi:hypothetical protein
MSVKSRPSDVSGGLPGGLLLTASTNYLRDPSASSPLAGDFYFVRFVAPLAGSPLAAAVVAVERHVKGEKVLNEVLCASSPFTFSITSSRQENSYEKSINCAARDSASDDNFWHGD